MWCLLGGLKGYTVKIGIDLTQSKHSTIVAHTNMFNQYRGEKYVMIYEMHHCSFQILKRFS